MNKNLVKIMVIGVCLFLAKDNETLFPKSKVANTKVAVSTDEKNFITNIQKEFSSIESKEDKLLIYKLFSGSAEYLKNSKSLGSTSQFDPILGKVQSSYGWSREKYPKFTDAVSEYLVDADYDEPKTLSTTEERLNFSKIFETLAEATKYE